MFSSRFTALLTTTTLAALPAAAQTPNVVTDIAPVASLAAHVMGDLGTPRNLIKPGASPHDYALRPSDARALRDADVVFWIGGALTPWLEAPLETLSKNAEHVSLLNAEATKLIEPRDLGHDHHDHGADKHDEHDDHDHDHEKGHAHDEHDHEEEHDDHGHDEHKDHDHDEHDHEKEHDDHGHDEHNHTDAQGNLVDPHAWLDPSNAIAWLDVIAAALSKADPENQATYEQNAATTAAEIVQTMSAIDFRMAPHTDASYAVLHDAFAYFENRFGLEPAGAITLTDGQSPSPAHIASLRETLTEANVTCTFAEPATDTRLLGVATEGLDVRFATVDPLGTPAMAYTDLIANIADAMASCFEGTSN